MGQKINPICFRVSVNKAWDSKWYAKKNDYAKFLAEDLKIRSYIMAQNKSAAISKIIVERPAKKAIVTIQTARPGVLIGKKGNDIEKIKDKLKTITKADLSLNIVEIKKPETNAMLIAQTIAQQIEKRSSHKRAMKKAMQSAQRLGVKGIKVACAGRLMGAEIARTEWYREGRVPLHTIRANVDYARYEANTAYGVIGIKVWVYNDNVS